MDYEKKYKEALELARVAAFNGHQSLMEGIFPELKESEDEKTRKRIIALVNAHGQGMYKDDMLAWLENIPYTIDHEKREGFHLGYKAALEKQGESYTKRDVDDAYVEGMAFAKNELEKQGEQEPWSEEDEKMIGRLRNIVEKYAFSESAVDVNGDLCEKEYIDADNWLKSLKNRVIPQPKPAWSEEDKRMFDYALDMIEWYGGKNEKRVRLVSDWLKSLRPQNNWKPSNEQMKALDSVIDEYDGYPEFDSLVSLKNDLRKL